MGVGHCFIEYEKRKINAEIGDLRVEFLYL